MKSDSNLNENKSDADKTASKQDSENKAQAKVVSLVSYFLLRKEEKFTINLEDMS